jgi:alkanesulfonate monooxygenase SsuD/methylene tetrahydromethanopterin reductase-like flavin-dependent oxidoreductase (luciferase family)
VVEAVAADYVRTGHSTQHPPDGASQGPPQHLQHLDDAFVERFGVVGTPAHCVSRLLELAELGLDRVLLVEGRHPTAAVEQRRAHRCLAEEVLPALHAGAA